MLTNNESHAVIFYKSKTCKNCTDISNIWDEQTEKGKEKESIIGVMRKINPKLRFYTITADNQSGVFDEKLAPSRLIRYNIWFPMILLIPGSLWDQAMMKLGPNNPVELVDGVQVMNGKWDKDTLFHDPKYNTKVPSEYGRWLKDIQETIPSTPIKNSIIMISSNNENIHHDICTMNVIPYKK